MTGLTPLNLGNYLNDPTADSVRQTFINVQANENALYTLIGHKFYTNVADWGTTGNGTTDDTAAILAAIVNNPTGAAIFFPVGTYLISSALTFTTMVIFAPGATIKALVPVALAFNGGVTAPIQQIFNIVASTPVTINANITPMGYPEWWGCVNTNSSLASSNLAAINACLQACQVTQLQPGVYYVNGTVVHNQTQHTLRGYGNGNGGTVIVNMSSTTTTVQMGPTTAPTNSSGAISVSLFPVGLRLQDLSIQRNTGPDMTAQPASLLCCYTVLSYVDRVQVYDGYSSVVIRGTVSLHLYQCNPARTQNGTGSGTDVFCAFYYDGVSPGPFGAGAASTYINECAVGNGSSATQSYGFYATGNITDLFIHRLETGGVRTGIGLIGQGATNTSRNNWDISIRDCILDTWVDNGIYIDNFNATGAITISGGYTAAASNAQGAGITVFNSNAAVSITGMQHVLSQSPNAAGLSITSSSRITSMNNIYVEGQSNPVFVSGSTHCHIADRIKNALLTSPTPAVVMNGTCSHLVLDCQIDGVASAFVGGYVYNSNPAGSTLTYSEFRCTGMDPACLTVPNNGVVINNDVLQTGLYGTNLVLGTNPDLAQAVTVGDATATVGNSALLAGAVTGSPVGITAGGLDTNVGVYLSPKGAGAISAQVPNSATTGGNARGNYATDWQTFRTAATQVASGTAAFIGAGENNTASGSYAAVPGGYGNVADGGYAMAGGKNAITFMRQGALAWSSGDIATAGDSQVGLGHVLRAVTTSATPAVATSDMAAAAGYNNFQLQYNSAAMVRLNAIARNTATGAAALFTTSNFLVTKGATNALTALAAGASITMTLASSTGTVTGWGVVITADTTNGALTITCTGAASSTIHWAIHPEWIEVL